MFLVGGFELSFWMEGGGGKQYGALCFTLMCFAVFVLGDIKLSLKYLV